MTTPVVEAQTPAGYICKRCGGPSPVGVGYVDNTDGAYARSAVLDHCACGYSVTSQPPVPLDVLTGIYDSASDVLDEYGQLGFGEFGDEIERIANYARVSLCNLQREGGDGGLALDDLMMLASFAFAGITRIQATCTTDWAALVAPVVSL